MVVGDLEVPLRFLQKHRSLLFYSYLISYSQLQLIFNHPKNRLKYNWSKLRKLIKIRDVYWPILGIKSNLIFKYLFAGQTKKNGANFLNLFP